MEAHRREARLEHFDFTIVAGNVELHVQLAVRREQQLLQALRVVQVCQGLDGQQAPIFARWPEHASAAVMHAATMPGPGVGTSNAAMDNQKLETNEYANFAISDAGKCMQLFFRRHMHC